VVIRETVGFLLPSQEEVTDKKLLTFQLIHPHYLTSTTTQATMIGFINQHQIRTKSENIYEISDIFDEGENSP